jgi:6-phosphofructokinase 1
MTTTKNRLAIAVGGGPAPGINSVISAATIAANLDGVEVVGVRDGFKWLMKGDIAHVEELTIEKVSRWHFRGGCAIGIARDNPTKNPKHLEEVVSSLLRLDVDKLITIGGDDTAFTAMNIEQKAAGSIRVVHVPKTIDNDLALPQGISTFGYQTARSLGVEIVKNLMEDAQTTTRWYFVVSMGRSAGHLALGIGKATGATLTLIPEEFDQKRLKVDDLVDILLGSIIKRMAYGRSDGVAVLAEGLVELLDPKELEHLLHVERDAHDNIRIAEVNFGEIMKMRVQERLASMGLKITIVAKNIGYELRCADPIPFDMEYCRDLGYCAGRHILDGGSGDLVSMQEANFVPIPLKSMVNPATGKMRIRMVDPTSVFYRISRAYMIRLKKEDFEDDHELAKFAATAHLPLEDFKKQFKPVLDRDVFYKMKDAHTVRPTQAISPKG